MARLYSRFLPLLVCLLAISYLGAQDTEQDTILVDFGTQLSTGNWNNLTNFTDGAVPVLLNAAGERTRYGIEVSDTFRGVNTGGTTEPDDSLALPATATGDSFFGNGQPWGGATEPSGAVTLTNLRQGKNYNLALYASRAGTETRQTRLIVIGATRDTLLLEAGGTGGMRVRTSMTPAADSTIVIEAAAGPDNDTPEAFFYLGALVMNYDAEAPPPVVEVAADTFLVDFGTVPSPAPWNNVTDFDSGAVVTLANQVGTLANVRLVVVDSFRGVNTLGTSTPDAELGFPASATEDSFFGNTGPFNGAIQATGGIELTGLDPRTGYTLRIFGSRNTEENREAMYVVEGITTDTLYLNSANNTGELAVTTVFPTRDSSIVLTASPGPNNVNNLGFYYLNAMEVFAEATAVAPLDTVLVDFGGSNTTPPPYNNVTDPNAGKVSDLTNSAGFYTGYTIAVVDSFNNTNADGTQRPAEELGLAATATGDSFFGNTGDFGGQSQPTGAVELTGLNPAVTYTVELFASRTTSERRETQYVVEGAGSDTVYLTVSSNENRSVFVEMQPDAEGTLRITASSGPNNENSDLFYYLGVLRLIYPDMDPVGDVSLELTDPTGGEFWQAGKTADITWNARNLGQLGLEYSTDAGSTWTVIDTVPAFNESYTWTLPEVDTEEALVRITSDTLLATSDSTFTISTETTSCTIVVLGSSTAEGTGASTQDSSWVGRYQEYLADDTRYDVVNLGRSGYNTFRILPTGTDIPAGVNETIDPARNVTQALTYDPFAIIINMPSNDAAGGYGVAQQLDNFETVVEAAREAGVLVYVATTQPRNFTNPAQIQIQREVRDSILAIYGEMAIDFWTGLASADGFIVDSLDSGDGIHVNDDGHAILYQRVLNLQLDTVDCSAPSAVGNLPRRVSGLVKAYPNPAENGFLMLDFGEGLRGTADVQIIDVLGRVRLRDRVEITGGADHRIDISQLGRSSSSYFFVVVTLESADGYVRDILPVVIR
ncbi:lysophospholipase L1-like esterase [Neolewinella xylanilytica]|uniref:Lysophospholipase L1-like esterase n=1 Tax=Neolewinella xylanilytica TaxID=1514080 RepID=A0A2S6I3P8_9BACT|nr:GDSL-type esterase/lipase family protein [Neolewinella xylanilytica]PPK85806.1 lysophospholipase L1-like esterase [Neolewinella xylanilytica]